jgi:hypothetical protein
MLHEDTPYFRAIIVSIADSSSAEIKPLSRQFLKTDIDAL